MKTIHWKLSLAASLAAALTAAGCGGGATNDPNVVYKPAKEKTVAGNGNTTETTTNNGTPEATADGNKTPVTVAGGVGTLKGRVIFQGTYNALPPLYKQGDTSIKNAEVCAAAPAPDERLVVGADNGVANVFVYLPKAPAGAKFEAAKDPVYFNQKNCVFFPHCLLIQTTQPLMVMSEDPIAHNTHTYPSRSTPESKQIPGPAPMDKAVPFQYPRPELAPFEVKCDYHTWMKAYHLPLDHPFAAVTDKDGNFEIPNLPAGVHKFQVWHEGVNGGYLHRNYEITVEGGDKTSEVEIPYPQAKVSLVAAPPTTTIKLSALTGEE